MKKIGSILLSFLPFIITMAIQFFITFIGMFLLIFFNMFSDPSNVSVDPQVLLYSLLNSMDSNFLVSISAVYAILSSLVFSIWYYKKFAKGNTQKVSKVFNPVIIVALLILSISLQYLSTYIVAILGFLKPEWLDQYSGVIESLGLSESVSVITVLYAIIIAPISEELTFRGLTLGYARKAMPFWAANILQAALFGLLHMNFIQGIYAFVLGIVFGYVAKQGESLFIPILFHMMFNLLGVFLPSVLHYSSADSTFFVIIIFILSAAFLVAGLVLYHRGISKRNNRKAKEFSSGTDI